MFIIQKIVAVPQIKFSFHGRSQLPELTTPSKSRTDRTGVMHIRGASHPLVLPCAHCYIYDMRCVV